MLKLSYTDEKDIPEEHKALYQQVAETNEWKLVVDTKEIDDEVSRLREFRENNIQLKKQAEELNKKLEVYSGIDPDEAKRALENDKKLKEKKLIESGEMDKVIEQRMVELRSEQKVQLEAKQKLLDQLQADRDKLQQQIDRRAISDRVQEAVSSVRQPQKGAMVDILNRAAQVFSIDPESNSIVAKRPDGTTIYDSKNIKPLTPEAWAADLVATSPHLFQENRGSGARGGSNVGGKHDSITAIDKNAIGKNLEGVASGTVKVRELA